MLHYYHIKIELRLEAIRVLRSRLQLREKLKEKLVELAAESWHIKPEELLMVGDTPNDMRFAHNGHALALGVLSLIHI